jgi:hypothetical protein
VKTFLLLFLYTILGISSLFGKTFSDWMPDGMVTDKAGNVLHVVGLPSQLSPRSKTVSSLAFIGDIKKGLEIVNLSKKNVFKYNPHQKENDPPPNDGSGFLVSKYFRMGDWGWGLAKNMELIQGGKEGSYFLQYGAGPFAGIAFEIGAGLIGTMHVKKYNEIKKFPPFILIPTSLKSLKKYSVGDNFSYYIKGGIGVMAGIGAGINFAPFLGTGVSAGVSYILSGTWYCKVQKTGPTTVSVRYTKRELKKLSLYLGGKAIKQIFGASLKKIKGIDKNLFFEFNLSNSLGMEAYKKFLRGNTAFSTRLAHKLKAAKAFALSGLTTRKWGKRIMISAIRPLEKSHSDILIKEKMLTFSIPSILSIKFKKSHNLIVTNSRPVTDNLFVKTVLGIHSLEKEVYGWREGNRYQLSLFTGSYQTIRELDGKGDISFRKRFSANFKYQHKAFKLKEGDLEKELFYIINEVGHKKDILNIKIPKALVNLRKYIKIKNKKIPMGFRPKRKILGFVKLSLDLMMSSSAIKDLKAQALFNSPDRWINEGKKRALTWFSNPENKRWEICATMFKNKEIKLGRQLCQAKILKKTRQGLDLSFKSLVRMQKAISLHEPSKFAHHFSQFGKGFLSTRFSFLTLINSLTYGDIHMVLQYEGERIPRGELILRQSKNRNFKGLKVSRP